MVPYCFFATSSCRGSLSVDDVVVGLLMSDVSVPQCAWNVHLVRDNWKRSFLLFVFLAVLFSTIYWIYHSLSAIVLSAVFLIPSLHRYFVPYRYELYDDFVVVFSFSARVTKPWSDFRSFYVDRGGVLLSPFVKPSRLENFRGVYLRFGCSRTDEIVDFVRQKVSGDPIS